MHLSSFRVNFSRCGYVYQKWWPVWPSQSRRAVRPSQLTFEGDVKVNNEILESRFRKRARTGLAVLVIWATTVTGACQASETIPDKLSLNDAVGIALNNNARLRETEKNYINTQSDLRVAGLKTSYELVSTAAVERRSGESDLSNLLFSQMRYENLLGTEATVGVSPWGIGQQHGSMRIDIRHPLTAGKGALSDKQNLLLGARSNVSVQEKQFYLVRQSTVIEVINAYYRAILAREQVKVQERAAQISEKVAEFMRKRADARLEVEFQASQAEIAVAQAKNELNLRQQSARGALQNLMVAIGVGVGETPELIDTVPAVDEQLPGLAEAVQIALKNRAELNVFDTQLAEQERKLAMISDELKPRLDLVAGFNSTKSDQGIISTSLLRSGAFTTGFEYRLPVDKRRSLEKRESAERDIDILSELRLYRMERIADEVRSAYRGVESARISLEIFSRNIEQAEYHLALSEMMVEESRGTTRDLLEAQGSLARVEGGRLSAQVDLFLATVNLKHAMGEDLTVMGTR